MTTLVIDGYNLIYAIPSLRKTILKDGPESAREAFINICKRYKSIKKDISHIYIVFDGKEEDQNMQQRGSGISVIFGQSKKEADDIIIDLIRKNDPARNFTVVSSDNYVCNNSRTYSACLMSTMDFRCELEKRTIPKDTVDKKVSKVSNEDIKLYKSEITDWYAEELKSLLLTNELNPNESCVAVCWMKFSAALNALSGDSAYMNAFEKTLYNHLLGAQALDGHDFSYYQGYEGKKVHDKRPGAYSCCRYRGMNMLAHLPGFVIMQAEDGFVINLYTDSVTETEFKKVSVRLSQETLYPRDGNVEIFISPQKDIKFVLYLRIPDWCKKTKIKINGKTLKNTKISKGYLIIKREWKALGDKVSLNIDMSIRFLTGTISDRDSIACMYGPLVLAMDTHYGGCIETAEIKLINKKVRLHSVKLDENHFIPMVMFETMGCGLDRPVALKLVDYASAGSINPSVDRFKVWIPEREKGNG